MNDTFYIRFIKKLSGRLFIYLNGYVQPLWWNIRLLRKFMSISIHRITGISLVFIRENIIRSVPRQPSTIIKDLIGTLEIPEASKDIRSMWFL